ncbi:GNAT family N-acetyltransferase [Shewanella algae]|uniref:GNAT family N-acetyltransferase n=1 Tax=Shewanella algae TaxID=38313 RepID=UPI00313D78A7
MKLELANTADITLTEPEWALLLLADPSREAVQAYLRDCLLLRALDTEDRLLGLALLQLTPASTKIQAEVKNLAVHPDHQGQGIGKWLLQQCQTLSREKGLDSLWIATGNSSLTQLGLYQKCGFRIKGIVPDFFAAYPEPIVENGILCLDLLLLACPLAEI